MKKIIIGILIIIEIGLIMLNYNTSLSNKEIDKIEVKETEEIKGNNTLAIMVKSKEDNTYKPSDKNTWPTGDYKYAGSLCIGNDGRDIEESEVISFNNDSHTATITTKDTIYCYLYFAEGEDAVTRIERLSSSSLEPEEDVSAREDVLRRFQGTAEEVQNNYICFGTSITEECVNNTDRYMYRIIGYATGDDTNTNTRKGQLKLIKKEALNKTYQWWVNYDDNIEWPSSLIYANITTDAYLQNEYYVPNEWGSKIVDHTWWYGDVMPGADGKGTLQVGGEMFKLENAKKESYYYIKSTKEEGSQQYVFEGGSQNPHNGQIFYYKLEFKEWTKKISNTKVGIMNISDYYLSVGKENRCDINQLEGDLDCSNGWMHLSNNDSTAPSDYEWLMTREGWRIFSGLYNSFFLSNEWLMSSISINSKLSVRPVIYTTENITLNGSGTIDDPFIIVS